MPGTLPFAELEPHKATALEDMIHRLSKDRPDVNSSNEDMMQQDGGGAMTQEAPKIGKLRFLKSGKVVMRL